MIWRFEKKFVEQCSEVMGDALNRLGCELPYKVFLVGVHTETDSVTLVGADVPFEPMTLAEEIVSIRNVFVPHPEEDDSPDTDWGPRFQKHDQSCWECRTRIKDAIETLLEGTGLVAAVSPCCDVNGTAVVLVATYSKEDYARYPSLDMSVYADLHRTPSLLFGVIEAVLDKFGNELRKRDAGVYENDPPTGTGVLRTAGAFFTRIHAWTGKRFSPLDITLRGTLELFDACNVISALPYENRVGLGGMVIADPDHPAVTVAVQLERPILASDHKRVRKLLEMCQQDLCLLSDSRYVWGIGTFDRDQYDRSKVDVFHVQFVGHFRWELCHLDQRLMVVHNGLPKIPLPRVDPLVLGKMLRWRFPNLTSAAVSHLTTIVELATKQAHGTSIIISSDARGESARLASNKVRPFEPDATTLAGVTAIDGAIMLDLEGICHGIGLILDGNAGSGEKGARGARYNSLVRYTRDRSDCLGIGVSVDGMIDILPEAASAK